MVNAFTGQVKSPPNTPQVPSPQAIRNVEISVRIAFMATTAIAADVLPSFDPATGEVLERFEATPAAALPGLLKRARVAQEAWARLPIRERCSHLRELQEHILARRDELAGLVVRETGKPRVEALFADLFFSLDSAFYYSRNAQKLLRPERIPHHSTAAKAKTGRLYFAPMGVIGIISSWNYPLALPLGQSIPALAAGNAVVCKTSEYTPGCGAAIASLFAEAGFPKDLFTLVQGRGEIGGALIAAGPDKVIFTGSVATGRRVAEACAQRLIPSVLELGGKDAMLVLADANIEIAASGAVWGGFTNCGQVCLSIERVYVERAISESFVQRCAKKARALRLGPGRDPSTDVGPLIRPEQVARVHALVEDAVARGARLVCGGRPRPDLGSCFYEPTVLADVDDFMRLMQEETFGPILAVQTVRDPEEAVARANDSPFALAASIWTRDSRRGRELATRVRAGAVMVNDVMSCFAISEAPHGGVGASGWGRTHSKLGLFELVRPQYVDVDRLPARAKPWWYRYSAELDRAAGAFLRFEFSRTLISRLRNARGALKTIFRDHGI